MAFRLCDPCGALYLPGTSPRSVCPCCSFHLRRLSREEAHVLRNLLLADRDPLAGAALSDRGDQAIVGEQCYTLRNESQELRSHSQSLLSHSRELRAESRRLRRGIP